KTTKKPSHPKNKYSWDEMTGNLAVPPKFSNVTALDLQITAADRSNLFRWTPGRDGLLYR
ncbi:hypothetical protein B1O29_16230, partial [Listeria monocytogenes]|nr:hypothetical protein [Listeria monocytogenes]